MKTWNERFTEALAQSELTLTEVSRQAGLSHVSVLRWMGTPSTKPATDAHAGGLLRVCRLLGVRIEWVLEGELPMYARDEWPFSVSRERIERLAPAHRQLIDRLISDIVELFPGSNHENST